MAGRKRKAVNAQVKDSARPSDAIKADATGQKEESAAAPEAPPQLDFSDLPAHFLVQVAHKLTYSEMATFRLSCRKALEAVDHCGRTHRALDVTRLVGELWPEKREADANPHFEFLEEVDKELGKLSSWMDLDLISSIDFAGIQAVGESQLEAMFGDTPRRNVKKLSLVGAVVASNVWKMLARLFPSVKYVSCTEHLAHFPDEIVQELAALGGMAANVLVDQQQLEENDQLDGQRILTLRCLKRLFPTVRTLYID